MRSRGSFTLVFSEGCGPAAGDAAGHRAKKIKPSHGNEAAL